MGVLHRQERWEADLYWPLDGCVMGLAEQFQSEPVPKGVLSALMEIYNHAYGRLCFHRMSDDVSSIANLSNAECFEWSLRVQGVFTAAISSRPVRNDDFELENPLL